MLVDFTLQFGHLVRHHCNRLSTRRRHLPLSQSDSLLGIQTLQRFPPRSNPTKVTAPAPHPGDVTTHAYMELLSARTTLDPARPYSAHAHLPSSVRSWLPAPAHLLLFPVENAGEVSAGSFSGFFFFNYRYRGAMEAENKRKCRICNVCCSSIVQLCEHVTGSKHKIRLSLTAPHEVKRLGTIQLFLDMHMKAEPILGLEYIVETMVDEAYVYNCQLCDVQGDWRKLIGHLVDSGHMTRYIDKHYPELSLGEKTYPRKGEHLRALREISKKIVKSTLRKSIQAYKPGSADPNAIENAKGEEKRDDSLFKSDDEKNERAASPKESAAAEARRRVARKRASLKTRADMAAKVARLSVAARRNGALAAKRAILEEQSRPELREFEREPDWSLSIQELEFRRNQDLLNYLRNYKIECDGDAHYIQQIIRNCTDALCRFREQQAREESLQSPLPLPRSQPVATPYGYSGWNRSEGPCLPVNRMDPYPSGSRAPMPMQPTYPIRSPFPPSASAATEIFFKSIKNMEEGEVVNVFHKIAATNPAFRGINIPSVIQYLKDTGRLKP